MSKTILSPFFSPYHSLKSVKNRGETVIPTTNLAGMLPSTQFQPAIIVSHRELLEITVLQRRSFLSRDHHDNSVLGIPVYSTCW